VNCDGGRESEPPVTPAPLVPERGRLIWKIGDLILENAEELAQLKSLDNGKPVGVALAADLHRTQGVTAQL
jgi:acyl-CoA reductase-like NAD-dependent aldehyde dehydrogenase